MEHAPISKETAEAWLVHELRHNYLAGVLKASPSLLARPRALGAMTDFAYNLGVARYRASTLRKRVDAGDWEDAKEQLMLWVRGGGRVLPGLVKRRKAEAALL
jgi:lysozyme